MKVKFVFFVLVIAILISGGDWFSLGRKTNSQPASVSPPPPSVSNPSDGFRQFLKESSPSPGNSYIPPDIKIVEGIITKSELGKFVLAVDGRDFSFLLDKESLFRFPEGGKGATVGARLKVYYKEKQGKLYVVYGIELE